MEEKTRCGLCNKLVSSKTTMMVKYDKDLDVAICRMHKEVRND